MRGLGLLVLALGLWGPEATARAADLGATSPSQEMARIYVPRPLVFYDVLLMGDYLVVHDEEMAEKGEPCLFVYRSRPGKPDRLIVSIHCTRLKRERADEFRVATQPLMANVYAVRDVQFAGSTNVHRLY